MYDHFYMYVDSFDFSVNSIQQIEPIELIRQKENKKYN